MKWNEFNEILTSINQLVPKLNKFGTIPLKLKQKIGTLLSTLINEAHACAPLANTCISKRE